MAYNPVVNQDFTNGDDVIAAALPVDTGLREDVDYAEKTRIAIRQHLTLRQYNDLSEAERANLLIIRDETDEPTEAYSLFPFHVQATVNLKRFVKDGNVDDRAVHLARLAAAGILLSAQHSRNPDEARTVALDEENEVCGNFQYQESDVVYIRVANNVQVEGQADLTEFYSGDNLYVYVDNTDQGRYKIMKRIVVDIAGLSKIFVNCLAVNGVTLHKDGHHYQDEMADKLMKIAKGTGLDSALQNLGIRISNKASARMVFRTLTHHIKGGTKMVAAASMTTNKAIRLRATKFGTGNAKAGLTAAIIEESRDNVGLRILLGSVADDAYSRMLACHTAAAQAGDFSGAVKYGQNANYLTNGFQNFVDVSTPLTKTDLSMVLGLANGLGGTYGNQKSIKDDDVSLSVAKDFKNAMVEVEKSIKESGSASKTVEEVVRAVAANAKGGFFQSQKKIRVRDINLNHDGRISYIVDV